MQTGTASTAWVRAIGVYFAEGRLTITATAPPPLGKRTVGPVSVPVEEAGPGKALATWLESHLTPRQRRRIPVCIGLGAEQTFFTSKPMDGSADQPPTSEGLLSLIGGSCISGTDAVADATKVKLGGAGGYSIAACRRQMAEDFAKNLSGCGVTNVWLVPAPWVTLVLTGCKGKPRSWKTFIQVVLAKSGGLVVLLAHGQPVLWRRFASTAEDSADLISAIRHLQVHAKQSHFVRDIAGIAVVGPMNQEQAGKLAEEIGLTVVARDPRLVDDAEYSRTLAQWAHSDDRDSLNLLRSVRPPPTLRQMFPQKLVIIMAIAIAGMGLFLQNMLGELEGELTTLKRQNASYGWAVKLKTNQIESERKQLKAEVGAVQQFLGTRVTWSNYLRDLPTRLPRNACLTQIHGAFELEDANKKIQRRVNRSLMLRGMALFADRGAAPKEIDAFSESLREVDLLKKDFPNVNLAEIKWRKEGTQEIALFTVLALPPEKGAAKANSGKEGK